jgi:hypothetical protein
MQSNQDGGLVIVSLYVLFLTPTAYLVIWGIQNNKLKDWVESILHFRIMLGRLFQKYVKGILNEEEFQRRCTRILTLRSQSKHRKSTRRGTKVLL